jgi:hypothetical protein
MTMTIAIVALVVGLLFGLITETERPWIRGIAAAAIWVACIWLGGEVREKKWRAALETLKKEECLHAGP